jgi:hypothetical protein
MLLLLEKEKGLKKNKPHLDKNAQTGTNFKVKKIW